MGLGDDMWTLDRIRIYPIKSLPGVEVSESVILPAGNLQHDREFALVDGAGRFMNAKRTADIHSVRASFDLQSWTVALSVGESDSVVQFHLDADQPRLAEWFSDYFHTALRFVQQPTGGFPDDTEASGPTIISVETLNAVAEWFPGLTQTEVSRRFRANLELAGGEPFGEDRLFGGQGEQVPFRIGTANLWGNNPCQRCAVPTRDSSKGEIWPGFQKIFATQREAALAPTTNWERFNHFYRLAVNTVVRHAEPQSIRIGDEVRIVANSP